MTDLERRIDAWSKARYPGRGGPEHKLRKLADEVKELIIATRAYERAPSAHTRAALAAEIGDVAIILTTMAGLLGLSLEHITQRKFESVLERCAGVGPPLKD